MKIFVSYTTRDKEVSIDNLRAVASKLSTIGDAYIDIIHNDSIDKQKRVFQELDNSDVVILINSKNVIKSVWVEKEIKRANHYSIPIANFSMVDLINLDILLISQKIRKEIDCYMIQKCSP